MQAQGADEALRARYRYWVEAMRPKKPLARNLAWAFGVGGAISEVGQWVQWFFQRQGMSPDQAGTPTAIVLVGLGALATGLGWYDRLTKVAGMGASLPITGFANAMVAPAMEFRSEGLVLGVGAKLFTVAGPVLGWGMAAAFVVGLARLVLGVRI
ncbi:MAG: SpoVA/SpoVAEb family sporulation membrane protein [Firmicutes bacterium]|nr:SpoVA/SpoVAEb family sporulation membrane protein [Alicyclobacillaceae bacterium]MCL6496705.1 SpoVA/SpoVAEb family sporulation membrane protein [Bacillota bacterium]